MAPLVEPRRAARRPPRGRAAAPAARAAPAISPRSFSARSAALAWSASGRSRFCTSASRSRARSTCDRDARELQLGPVAAALEPAEPGRLLDQRAPLRRACSRGSPRPCPGRSRRDAAAEARRRRAARRGRCGGRCARLTRYWPSPPRCSRRTIETSAYVEFGHAPSSLSKSSSTSQQSAGWRPVDAGEEDVVRLLGAQLGRAQRARRPEQRVGDVRLARSRSARR